MTELLSNDWFRLTVISGVARVTRLPTPAPSPDEMAARWTELSDAVVGAGVRRLLLDLRSGPPGRNDP